MTKEIQIDGQTYQIRDDQAFMVINGYAGIADLDEEKQFKGWAYGASVGPDFEKLFTQMQSAALQFLPDHIKGVLTVSLVRKH